MLVLILALEELPQGELVDLEVVAMVVQGQVIMDLMVLLTLVEVEVVEQMDQVL